jgi:predicted transposase YdaD
MQYDIAFKTLLECAKEDFFLKVLNEKVQKIIGLRELPKETVSVRSSDFPVHVIDFAGKELIHLIEFQSQWKVSKIWSMLQYKARFTEKYRLPVKSTMVLLKENKNAVDFLKDAEIEFKFNLIKLWELPAEDFLINQCLLPMIPLMRGGQELTIEAERLIYESEDEHRADHLTILSIFAGMKNKSLSMELIKRRRDIMIESPVYDLIIQEGIEKGIEQGIEKGAYQKACQTAKAMLKKGMDQHVIAEVTDLSFEDIERLAKEID